MKSLKTVTRNGFKEPLEVEIFEHLPGESDLSTLPGDLLFTFRSGRFISEAIAWLTNCEISHMAVVVDHGGYIAESLGMGLEVEHISKYRYNHYYWIIRFEEGNTIAKKAQDEVFSEERPRYGYMTIFSLLLSSVYQKIFRRRYEGIRVFGNADRIICSAFGARCAEAVGYKNEGYLYASPCEVGWDCGIPESVFDEGHLY